MGGLDLAASLSGSSSATSGARVDSVQGDFIIGGQAVAAKARTPWVWIALFAAAGVVALVFVLRR